ncbi:MAG TPA: hypothetical protein PK587_12895 [Syntrophales bacterium]|nr:hypothetical protein [Syntrophales bacterium]
MIGHSGERMMKVGAAVADTIRENPVVSTLVGVGVGWLIAARQKGLEGLSESIEEMLEEAPDKREVREKAADVAERTRESAKKMGSRAMMLARQFGSKTREQMGDTGKYVKKTYEESPGTVILTAAAIAAVAAGIGYWTSREK